VQVQEGEGWRLLVDPARCPFSVLIGGEGWAAELTASELDRLVAGVARLADQHAALRDQLMAEEDLSLEWESGDLWLALEGDRHSWQLRFVLSPARDQRGVEGAWSAPASRALAAALAALRWGDADPQGESA
jgi:hypothetical protein